MPLTDGTRPRRFPYVTALLIAANLIVWIFYTRRARTVGGLVFNELGRRPREGDEVEAGGARLRVEQLDGHRITRLLVRGLHAGAESRRTCDDESSSSV
jgi:Mg2+/Co2+ transporter CorB